jgi:branched-chain amino acid transport system permease protein
MSHYIDVVHQRTTPLEPLLAHIIQLGVQGLAVGAIYGLVALGLGLGYKATEVMNFAHGDILMLAAFLAWGLVAGAGLSFWVALPCVVLLVMVLCYALEAGVMRRIVGQPQFAGILLTIGLGFMIRGLVSMTFGPESRTYETPWTGRTTRIAGIVISDLNLAIVATAVAVTAGLYAFLRRTDLGVAVEASAQNQLAAYLCGVRVKRLNSLVWALSGAVAAACGMLLAPISLVDLGLWSVMLKAVAALVLGGLGSAPGAIAGGLLIGLVEQFAGVYLPDGFKDIMAYLVLIVVLVVRPHGLFGQAHGRRV